MNTDKLNILSYEVGWRVWSSVLQLVSITFRFELRLKLPLLGGSAGGQRPLEDDSTRV